MKWIISILIEKVLAIIIKAIIDFFEKLARVQENRREVEDAIENANTTGNSSDLERIINGL